MMAMDVDHALKRSDGGNADVEYEWVPKVGKEFNSIDDAWSFWVYYGGRLGFGCRRQYGYKSVVDKQWSSFRFVCSKEGVRKPDKRDHQTKVPRAETRTNCPVRLGIKRDRESRKYHIYDFIAEHNHPLHSPETAHMIPSQRKMSKVHAHEVEMVGESGIRMKASHELMERRVGGLANLGYTRLDQKNYLRTKRQRELVYGETGSLLRYFQQHSQQNQSFYYAMQLDNEEHITNIFWADAQMIIDYAHFGDVVTFDTTYCTNKEYKPFGVFVGFNHHKGCVVFGAALIYDETAESFKWLFEAFLEAHNGKKPQTIFTDQDNAMANALGEVMPGVYHGLCTFHIMQNCVKHLGNLPKEEGCFLREFKACIYEYEDEIEFETAWKAMLCKYHVENNLWLDSIYKLKHKWATCYMKMAFTIDMRNTQLSESLNVVLKNYLKCDLDIIRFLKHFERVVSSRRYDELEAEYGSRQKLPRIRNKYSPFLNQVSNVYTPHIFELFHDEVDGASAVVVRNCSESGELKEYVVGMRGLDKEYKVLYGPLDETVTCTCRLFESFGILCRHAIRILDTSYLNAIPTRYILERWTRQVREGVVQDTKGKDVLEDVSERYRILCHKLVKLASRASESRGAFSHINSKVDGWLKEVEDMNKSNCASLPNNSENVEQTGT